MNSIERQTALFGNEVRDTVKKALDELQSELAIVEVESSIYTMMLDGDIVGIPSLFARVLFPNDIAVYCSGAVGAKLQATINSLKINTDSEAFLSWARNINLVLQACSNDIDGVLGKYFPLLLPS